MFSFHDKNHLSRRSLMKGLLTTASDLAEKEGADLIAMWVWHFPPHPKYNVTGSTYPTLLKKIREFNDRHANGEKSQTQQPR